MTGCPISGLPDYRKIVLRRLPQESVLDETTGEYAELENDTNIIITQEDELLLKELVADGLLVRAYVKCFS